MKDKRENAFYFVLVATVGLSLFGLIKGSDLTNLAILIGAIWGGFYGHRTEQRKDAR